MTALSAALTSLLVFAAMPAAAGAGDLSRYRNFQLGTNLPTVAKQAGANPSHARTIHLRPALIQELAWRPQSLGSTSQREPAQEVLFSFHDGELFQIVVNYDQYETEGLTANDIIDAISMTYGTSAKPPAAAKSTEESYGDRDEILARWQDSRYRFDLIRSSSGPSFKLVGVLKRLEATAQAAINEATRLDVQEAPQRDAARVASEAETERARLAKSRLLNKPKFRP
jgi:hypothetical protein